MGVLNEKRCKTRRYRKRNNKSRRTRKNKTTRRYKKQMKGGNVSITSEEELKKSWENTNVKSWVVNDGAGTMMKIFREDAATSKKMPYEKFKEKINYYLEQVVKGQNEAYIKEQYL
jgi:hypothetical protein